MSSERHYFKLGLFVVSGIGLIVAGVIIFGAGVLLTDNLTIETVTNESVEGLDIGSAVKYMGVPVGKITKIEMASWKHSAADPAKQAEIGRLVVIEMAVKRALIRANSDEEIRKRLDNAISHGFRVRMASSGITGPAFLEAMYLDPKEHPPLDLPFTPEHMYVPSTQSTITRIVNSVEDILVQVRDANIKEVIAHADKLLTDTNKAINDIQAATVRDKAVALIDEVRGSNKRVKEILNDPRIDKTIQDLSEAMASGKQIVAAPEIKQVIADLPKISERMRSTMTRVDEIVHDPKLQKALDGVTDTASNAAPAVVELRRVLRQLDVLMASQRQDLESIVVNLRRILENGSVLIEDTKNNPSRTLFGAPPPKVEIGGSK